MDRGVVIEIGNKRLELGRDASYIYFRVNRGFNADSMTCSLKPPKESLGPPLPLTAPRRPPRRRLTLCSRSDPRLSASAVTSPLSET